MRKALFLAAIFTMGCVALPNGLLADTGAPGPNSITPQAARTPHQAGPDIAARLQLTDQQRQQLLDHKTEYRKRVSDLRCQLKLKRAERTKEMQNPNPDKDKLQLLSQEIGQIHGQLLVVETNARADFEKILTPQQLETWKKIRLEERDKNSAGFLEDRK